MMRRGRMGRGLCCYVRDKDFDDGGNFVDLFGGDFDPEMSVERCNVMLENRERISDGKAMEFFRWMRIKGKLKRNVNAYKVALRVLGRRRDWDGAEIMIQEMVNESGCELSFQQGKLQKAELVLISMHKAGFPSHIVAYNTMITGYGKVFDMDAAQSLFLNLEKVGLKPDETTYMSMIEGWGRMDNYKEAERYYKELKGLGFSPNSSNLYTMIKFQSKHGDEEGAIKTLNEMITLDCQYSSVLGILIQAYERAGKFDKVPSVVTGSFYEHVLINQT
ncbi:hypothetical protein POM88_041217 [Heracleum sosnowskyi]|uniref:Pentatricopeptide repeat-containing protein n=1 Tax=Heracleum sosnowskyi TaxID=360622 RepID=A0AAD8M9I2_9APIA|nr:hypothetical protein POM88_041217 [Heracleum sosnowskyi]